MSWFTLSARTFKFKGAVLLKVYNSIGMPESHWLAAKKFGLKALLHAPVVFELSRPH